MPANSCHNTKHGEPANQLTSTVGCVSTPGASRNTPALFHSFAIADSVLDGCSLIVLTNKSVPAVEKSLSASPQHPSVPGATQSNPVGNHQLRFPSLLQQNSPKHWERHLTLFPAGACQCAPSIPVTSAPGRSCLDGAVWEVCGLDASAESGHAPGSVCSPVKATPSDGEFRLVFSSFSLAFSLAEEGMLAGSTAGLDPFIFLHLSLGPLQISPTATIQCYHYPHVIQLACLKSSLVLFISLMTLTAWVHL